jgi:hypothetical protein
MADQSSPDNYMCVVDTTVESSSAFNAACRIIASLNQALQSQDKKNKLYLLHLSNLHSGLFTSNEKKEERSKDQESCTKSILTYFGKRLIAYDIPFHLIGAFCETKSHYSEKIASLTDRFLIGGIFIGTQKITIPSNLKSNVFRINRRMGFLPDKSYLKDIIHNTDCSYLKSLDETTGLVGYESKLDSDFLEYRFVQEPVFEYLEKEIIVAEMNGEQRPKMKRVMRDIKEKNYQLQGNEKESGEKGPEVGEKECDKERAYDRGFEKESGGKDSGRESGRESGGAKDLNLPEYTQHEKKGVIV